MTAHSYSRTEDYLVYTPGHRNLKSHLGILPTTNNALGWGDLRTRIRLQFRTGEVKLGK